MPIMDVPVDTTALTGVAEFKTATSAEKAEDIEPTCHQIVINTESFPLDP